MTRGLYGTDQYEEFEDTRKRPRDATHHDGRLDRMGFEAEGDERKRDLRWKFEPI